MDDNELKRLVEDALQAQWDAACAADKRRKPRAAQDACYHRFDLWHFCIDCGLSRFEAMERGPIGRN